MRCQIDNPLLRKLYSNFSFLYFPFFKIDEREEDLNNINKNQDNDSIKDYLTKYLQTFKFITYQIRNIPQEQFSTKENTDNSIQNTTITMLTLSYALSLNV